MIKNEKIKANPSKKSDKSHTIDFCNRKIVLFQDMITRTILTVQKYKVMYIIRASDMNLCIHKLESLYKHLMTTHEHLNKKKRMSLKILL